MQTANQITIGSQVIYRCPWTGYSITGEVKQGNEEWGEGFFDIRPECGGEIDEDYLDTAIHTTDILKTVGNRPVKLRECEFGFKVVDEPV